MSPRGSRRLGGRAPHPAALAALLAVSCSAGDGPNALGRLPCELPSDCPSNFACVESVCVAADPSSLFGVHVELTPPPGSRYVKTQVLDVDLTGEPSPLDLVLPEPATVRVLAFDDRGSRSRPINARMSLARSDGIPGREQVLVTDLVVGNARAETVLLNPGEYNATLTSTDARPSLGARFTVRPGSGATVTKEFHFGPSRRMFGTVTSSLRLEEKLSGVRVQAFSTTSGLASTADVTDEDGTFTLELPSTQDTSFLLTAQAPEARQPTWGYEEVVIVPLEGDREKNIALEPTRAMFQGRAKLRFGGESPEGFVGVGGANVTLTASVAVSTRVFRRLGTTDPQGYFSFRESDSGDVRLIRGTYTVEVEPPQDSPFGHTIATLDLTRLSSEASADLQIALNTRRRFSASVESAIGPVGFASVELRPLTSPIAPAFTATDPNGAFELWLDPGVYLLAVQPIDTLDLFGPLPVFLKPITIEADQPATSAVFQMPSGSPVTGSVLGATDLNAVAGTQIEVLLEVEGETVSIGRAVTGPDGRFSILLPEL